MEAAVLRSVSPAPPAAAPAPARAEPPPPAVSAPGGGGRAGRWLRLHRPQIRAAAIGLISLVLFVGAWQLLTANRVVFYVRFVNVPAPTDVIGRAIIALRSPIFGDHVLISCRRILFGFLLAGGLAVPLGLLMGRFRLLREIAFPICEVMRPIPAIAWVPMAIMLWPTNEGSIIFITFLGSFFPILINTLQGMATVDPVLVRAARCLGAREAALFREVYLPASLPQIFTGLTVGMGVAWVSLIAAEMISGQFGIGYFTWEAYSLVQYSDIALGMITIGILGLASSFAIRFVGRLAMPWSAAR
ncbi:ABC transporter permease [Methylobacterium sp. sgz302541]|uniref:ABC transporter permease n=1 Tax=unclassified Methylobacterium TaxID=2615210 RepID=UPI003D34BE29